MSSFQAITGFIFLSNVTNVLSSLLNQRFVCQAPQTKLPLGKFGKLLTQSGRPESSSPSNSRQGMTLKCLFVLRVLKQTLKQGGEGVALGRRTWKPACFVCEV